jgi:cysteine synthase A
MESRVWVQQAIQKIEADFTRSADTHLLKLEWPARPDIQVYLKDESTHITGSLKHRLARSLFLYGLCNGWIHHHTPIIEASSGSTAVSEAYFARLLGLPFVAVMPKSTSARKIAQITFYGGECYLVEDPSQIYAVSRDLAADLRGHFMDQFTYAERATDWRGNNNIAQSIYAQLRDEPAPIPQWIVVGAGTGGTAATIGRYLRYQRYDTRLCVVDPEHSIFYEYYKSRDPQLTSTQPSRIEGIGRPRIEPSFIPEVVDRMSKVPDAASVAAIHFLEELVGRKCGGSTGTNIYGTMQLLAEMVRDGVTGSVVTLICDAGDRYLDTYYNAAWIEQQGYHLQPYLAQLRHFYATAEWQDLPLV